ncbi:hypothetical protein K435DRAFT_818625 [Dendrothele bispora CBS 962.96]|uniref:Uncharacterized protein n=1 Tax=Dendrothele bispora (strain CBS 962.96) TaxID=1314807 RepID=A0A4S8M9V8_DENBC|nr:hypothetical protein K435DRAFT_818625 [Dendrothele bispora CBS 962.96]
MPKPHTEESWAPFSNRIEFNFAHYHFVQVQTSADQINNALNMWAASTLHQGFHDAPWQSEEDLYATIDLICEGHVSWKTYKVKYQGPLPSGVPPKWITQEFDLCCRDANEVIREQLGDKEFDGKIHYAPYWQFENGERQFSNLMSRDWAYKQANTIAEDEKTLGSMFVPIILGSDKTTVSVATGNQEFHPGYISPGNITNVARRAHGKGVLPFMFFPIPKKVALEPLKSGMTMPEVVKCPNSHFRRAIYGLGPYIANYPEQVLLTEIVQNWCLKCLAKPDNLDGPDPILLQTQGMTEFTITQWDPGTLWDDWGMRVFTFDFPHANIHRMLSPDLLHQIIKGTFKDHIVTWVNKLIIIQHGHKKGKEIINDIDHRLSAVPTFPGIRHFPQGRDFKQWTGNDSKALMKIYLAAIKEYALLCFLDFFFICEGVRDTISLPRQHAMVHYPNGIVLYGAPNGLCSSITKSKHIEPVKETWRQASPKDPLPQMLKMIAHLDQFKTIKNKFERHGMLIGTVTWYTAQILASETLPTEESDNTEDEDKDIDECGPLSGPRVLSSIEMAKMHIYGYPRCAEELGPVINQPTLQQCIHKYLYDHYNPAALVSSSFIPVEQLPHFLSYISVYHSALTRFYSPSDLCGMGGMYRQRIQSNPEWYDGKRLFDTVLIEVENTATSINGMIPVCILLFFSFILGDEVHECAFVRWFIPANTAPNKETGMWIVKPEWTQEGEPSLAVVPLTSIVQGCHLIPQYGHTQLPEDFDGITGCLKYFFIDWACKLSTM